ncbi:antirestriction protein [Pseudoduganella lurida]|nr:antirestriction protein [Pseudoduganella lurida]
MGVQGVTAQRVGVFQRMKCLPQRFGVLGIVVEQRVYHVMGEMCRAYDGGYWDYYELSNGGFYMAPRSAHAYLLEVAGNGYRGSLSADAAGIVACAMAYSHLSFERDGADCARAFHQLRAYLLDHPEQREILRAID